MKEQPPSALSFQSFLPPSLINQFTSALARSPPFQPYPSTLPTLQPQKYTFQCHHIPQNSSLADGHQFETYYLYAFVQNQTQSAQIIVYTFNKKDGRQKKITIKDIAATVVAVKIIVVVQGKEKEEKGKVKVLLGTSEGFVKCIDLHQPSAIPQQLRLDCKPIVQILPLPFQFCNTSLALFLSSDTQIFLLQLSPHLQTLSIFRPRTAMLDPALSISLNTNCSHLLQSTQGGYIVLWRLDQVRERVGKMMVEREKRKIRSKEKEYYVFAYYYDHGLTIQGFVWVDFYGALVMAITKEGILKIIAYIFSHDNQHLQLLSHPLPSIDTITHIQLFPQQHTLIFSRNTPQPKSYLQLLTISPTFLISKHSIIQIDKLQFIDNFYLTPSSDILMCGNNKGFVVNRCIGMLEGIQKRQEDEAEEY